MNNKTRVLFLVFALMAAPIFLMAQPAANAPVEMADAMRANGMIYVVIAVVLTILAGLLFYVYRLDRKITRLEKASK
jgi:Na+/proline symporter